jgi:hypothetical protein
MLTVVAVFATLERDTMIERIRVGSDRWASMAAPSPALGWYPDPCSQGQRH